VVGVVKQESPHRPNGSGGFHNMSEMLISIQEYIGEIRRNASAGASQGAQHSLLEFDLKIIKISSMFFSEKT